MKQPKYTFSLKRELGSGAYANVYLGCERTSEGNPVRKVAIKRIDKQRIQEGAPGDTRVLRMMRNEITLLRELRCHVNVIMLLDHYESAHHIDLILEYCDGGDLKNYLKNHTPLQEVMIHDFMSQLSSAVQHTRSHSVVHRDIKPENVLMHHDPHRRSGFVIKLTDFGLACRLGAGDLTRTICGSPLHMAPELISGKEYDPKIDLWSLGTLAYQMATGSTPFRANKLKDLKKKLREAERTGAARRHPLPEYLSSEFVDLVHALLHLDSKLRIGFEEFYAHPFFAKTFSDTTSSLTESLEVVSPEMVPLEMIAPPLGPTMVVEPGPTSSYIMVDQRATQFAEGLDKIRIDDADGEDDVHQAALRKLAESATQSASLVLYVARGGTVWERLVLHGRALMILRDAASQAREKLFAVQRPCRKTIALAFKFRECMEHCVSTIDELKGSTGCEASGRTSFEMLCEGAIALTERAGKHARVHDKLAAELLYRDAIVLLGVVRRECSSASDRDRIDRYIESTERRLHTVLTSGLSQVGMSTMNTDSRCLGGDEEDITASKTVHAKPMSSAPIPIPMRKTVLTHGSPVGSPCRARFCGGCGMKFETPEENFCSMCGTQRTALTGSSTLASSVAQGSLPESWHQPPTK